MNSVMDQHRRPMRSLRLSVTDRCNLRCRYCMPEADYRWLPRPELLSFEELRQVAATFLELGVRRLRLTGGEPLLRQDLPKLVAALAALPDLEELALTSNGLLMAEQAAALRAAGLDRVTLSLDTLKRERFRELSRVDGLARFHAGLEAVQAAGFPALKLDTVVLAGVNQDEIVDLLDFARDCGAEIRFIEYMDVGGATRWRAQDVVTKEAILAAIAAARGGVEALADGDPKAPDLSAPARRYRSADGQLFGVIASTTTPFCGHCDRARLTADGHFYDCLYATSGLDLRHVLREQGGEGLRELLAAAWRARTARGAERRLEMHRRGPQFDLEELLADPRLEMHTKGG